MSSLLKEKVLIINGTARDAHLVDFRKFDRIFRTGFFAHSTKTAAKEIDFKFNRIFFLVRAFSRLNVDTLSRTHRRAKHASRTVFNTIRGLDVVHAAVVVGIVPTFFRVLNCYFFRKQHVPHCNPKSFNDFDDVQILECFNVAFYEHEITALSFLFSS